MNRIETRSSPDSLAATRRGFTFCVAAPASSAFRIHSVDSVNSV